MISSLSILLASLALTSAIPAPSPSATNIPTPPTALQQLQGLIVAPLGSLDGYSHSIFLPRWSTVHDHCNTREVVLERDGTDVIHDPKTCKITSGSWISPYDGVVFDSAAKIDIDHMVPLANAWASGASAWTSAKRLQFANDLVHPQLLAVGKRINEIKGDKTPDLWKPPVQSFWCTYAESWVTVKSYWVLTVTSAEKDALREMLESCST